MTEGAQGDIERLQIDGAACVLYRDAPSWNGRPTAAIGCFSCDTAEAGEALLGDACVRLSREGFEAAVGPMDGDTWHRYRLVADSDGRAPFYLEPTNPDYFPRAFDHAGFSRIAEYVSAIDTSLVAPSDTRRPTGIRVRRWRNDEVQAELSRIHALSLGAFARNAFYRPIDFPAFAALYEPLIPAIDPDLVLMAENEAGDLVGFLFALPDRLQGPAPDTVILKTYASVVKGVGGLLVDRFYRTVRERGFTAVIHALIHSDNLSFRHSQRRSGEVFRRYALWGRVLSL